MEQFEWDPNKEKENIENHKIDFITASRIWDGGVLEYLDDRYDYGEVRYQAFGAVDERLMVVVFTWRGESRRIISARKANTREKKRFQTESRHLSEGEPN